MTARQYSAIRKDIEKFRPEHLEGLNKGWLDFNEYHDGYQYIVEVYSSSVSGEDELLMKVGFNH